MDLIRALVQHAGLIGRGTIIILNYKSVLKLSFTYLLRREGMHGREGWERKGEGPASIFCPGVSQTTSYKITDSLSQSVCILGSWLYEYKT